MPEIARCSLQVPMTSLDADASLNIKDRKKNYQFFQCLFTNQNNALNLLIFNVQKFARKYDLMEEKNKEIDNDTKKFLGMENITINTLLELMFKLIVG